MKSLLKSKLFIVSVLLVSLIGIGWGVYRWNHRQERAALESLEASYAISLRDYSIFWGGLRVPFVQRKVISNINIHNDDELRLIEKYCDLSFVNRVEISGSAAPVRSLKILEQCTAARELEIEGVQWESTGPARLPTLPSIYYISIVDSTVPVGMFAGTDSNTAPSLRGVGWVNSTVTDKTLRDVSQIGLIDRMSLYDCPDVSDAGIRTILDQLKIKLLVFSNVRLAKDGFDALISETTLTDLRLDQGVLEPVTFEQLDALANSPFPQQLRIELPLDHNTLNALVPLENSDIVILAGKTVTQAMTGKLIDSNLASDFVYNPERTSPVILIKNGLLNKASVVVRCDELDERLLLLKDAKSNLYIHGEGLHVTREHATLLNQLPLQSIELYSSTLDEDAAMALEGLPVEMRE